MAGGNSRVLLAATVTEIGHGPFVYPACSQCYCKLTSTENNSHIKCDKCNCLYSPEDVYHRFRLCATITDSLSTANITAFGGMLDLFFGATASKFHKKMLCLQEKYPSLLEDLVKHAVEQTFIGQNLLFGFKVNPSVLQKSISHVPRQQVHLSDVVNDSMRTGFQTVGLSQGKPQRNLIAVQIALQGEPDQDFKTVIDEVYELARKLEEKLRIQPNCLARTDVKNFVNCLYAQNGLSLVNQPPHSISPISCGRSLTESSYSDNNLSSESELSSIRLSCDRSIQKLKGAKRKGPLLNITNIFGEMAKSDFLVKQPGSSKNVLLKMGEENQEKGSPFLRRSKRILAKKEKRNYMLPDGRNVSAGIDICYKSRKHKHEKYVPKSKFSLKQHNVLDQGDLSNTRSSSSKTDKTGVKSRDQILNDAEVEASLFQIRFDDKSSAGLSDNQCAFKENRSKPDCNIPSSNSLLYFENSNTTLQQETLQHEETTCQTLINRSSPSSAHFYSQLLESEMELTMNVPSQLEPTLTHSFDHPDSQQEQHGYNIKKPMSYIHKIPNEQIEEWPESENLYDFLRAGQFHSETYEDKTSKFDKCRQDKNRNENLMQAGQLIPTIVNKFQINVNYCNKNSTPEAACDNSMMINYLDDASFANVTCRTKCTRKMNISQKDNLTHSFVCPIFHKSAVIPADVTTDPESEDIYEFSDAVGPGNQRVTKLDEINTSTTFPTPEKTRVSHTSTSGSFDEKLPYISKLQGSYEASIEAQTSMDIASKDYEELNCSDNQTDKLVHAIDVGIDNNISNESIKMSLQNSIPAHPNANMPLIGKIFSNLECLDNDNLRQEEIQPSSDFKIFSQLSQNKSSNDRQNAKNDPFRTRLSSSPDLNASCDLFESSLSIPITSSGQALRSPPLWTGLVKITTRSDQTSSGQCARKQINYDNESGSNHIENYKHVSSTCISARFSDTPRTGKQKVRFKRTRKEILFHDFEIISHLPVPCVHKKHFKSCLKKGQSPAANDNSQDLFESPQQAWSTKPPEFNSKYYSSFSNHRESSPLTSLSNSLSFSVTTGPIHHNVSGSQELFSSGSEDSPQQYANSYAINKFEVRTDYFKFPIHESTPATQHTGQENLSMKSQNFAFANRDTNRDSLDLFSQSFC